MKNTNLKKGFTLLELVISMSIFLIFLTAIFSSFITITQTQRKANLSRQNLSEAREIFNQINQEFKEKSIDYNCYSTNDNTCINSSLEGQNEINEIALISNNGLERVIFRKEFDEDESRWNITSLIQERGNITQDWSVSAISSGELHSNELKISDAKFILGPNKNPYLMDPEIAANSKIQYQPNVHVILNVARENESNPIILQSTFTNRKYN